MRVSQQKVRQFHEHIGETILERPGVVSEDDAERRADLIREELDEYTKANRDGDIVEIADGIADMLYTVLGAAVQHGIDIQPIFDEVHASNMTKDPAPGPKKCVKGSRFSRPRIGELILIQTTQLEEFSR